jgi:hypothetical protein
MCKQTCHIPSQSMHPIEYPLNIFTNSQNKSTIHVHLHMHYYTVMILFHNPHVIMFMTSHDLSYDHLISILSYSSYLSMESS